MTRLNNTLLLLLALALLTLSGAQGYYLYKYNTSDHSGTRISYRVSLTGNCVLPPFEELRTTLYQQLRPHRRGLSPDQLHLSLVSGILSITLPRIDIDRGFFSTLGNRLSNMISSVPASELSASGHGKLILLHVEQIRINHSRPLDYLSLLSVLVFGLYLLRRHLKSAA